MAFCGSATPVFGHEAITGKFSLHKTARLGDTVLPPGTYLFTIEPTGIVLSMSSIPATRSPVSFIVRPEKGAGPIAIVFAMASPTDQTLGASQLVLASGKAEGTMQFMYLEKQKLLVDFDWSRPKDKTEITAQVARPQGGSSSSRATDSSDILSLWSGLPQPSARGCCLHF